MVELNETNCKEFTADNFEAKMKELHTKELRKAIAKNNKTQYRSEEWKVSEKELSDLKKDYLHRPGLYLKKDGDDCC
jgi:hypothetical protein